MVHIFLIASVILLFPVIALSKSDEDELPFSPEVAQELQTIARTEDALNAAIAGQADTVKTVQKAVAATSAQLVDEKRKLQEGVVLQGQLGKKLQELVSGRTLYECVICVLLPGNTNPLRCSRNWWHDSRLLSTCGCCRNSIKRR